MPMCLSLLLLCSNPTFCPAFAEDIEGKRFADVVDFAFVFPNIGAERTSADACYRRGRVLRVRILLYSGSIEGLCERDVRNIEA